jgi:type VI secretion system protein ImpF
MSDRASRERLQPSLLDRLTDDTPDSRREGFDQQTLTMTQLRRAVLRDLSWLLNTTNLATDQDLAGTPLAAKSVINFGIPGFAGMTSSTARIGGLEAALLASIRSYEPRIRPDSLSVTVRPGSGDNPDSALHFEIRGELWAQPVPQQLFLESSIELETRLAVVDEAQARG